MFRKCAILTAALLALPITAAHAGPAGEQSQARRELRAGKILSVRDIEATVLKGWEYLGFEYDPTALAYRLKFLRQGNVMFIDVDARTGAILRQTR